MTVARLAIPLARSRPSRRTVRGAFRAASPSLLSALVLALVMPGVSAADADRTEAGLPAVAARIDASPAAGIAVLHEGRVKPLLVAATETVREIHGRARLARRHDPIQTYLALTFFFDSLRTRPIVLIEHRGLRAALGLPVEGKHASYAELADNPVLASLGARIEEKNERKIRLTAEERAARDVIQRLETFTAVAGGYEWRIMPGRAASPGEWRLPAEVTPAEAEADPIYRERAEGFLALASGFHEGDQGSFDHGAAVLARNPMLVPERLALEGGGAVHAGAFQIRAELFYHRAHLFRLTWILLAGAFLAVVAASAAGAGRLARVATASAAALSVAALLSAAAGMALRVAISGRAPVTNMFETTVWVGFGLLLFGIAFAALYRSRLILGAIAGAGVLVFVLADNLPGVLPSEIRPLVPVLRSNFWLTLHVLTVTISYAAFLLAMAVGNAGIFLAFLHGDRTALRDRLSHFAYRAMQLGVALLAAGIILGGVWADYSWGRFWGWDPKETWSLIAALGYLMVLHGRFTGWIRSFGTLMGAVLGFYGVVMAWYGVNFILASGLHSYGFSEGGAAAMGVYVLVQGAFAAACAWRNGRATAVPPEGHAAA